MLLSALMPVSVASSQVVYDALKACGIRLLSVLPETWVGVETVGTDAGRAATFDPPFPSHHKAGCLFSS